MSDRKFNVWWIVFCVIFLLLGWKYLLVAILQAHS